MATASAPRTRAACLVPGTATALLAATFALATPALAAAQQAALFAPLPQGVRYDPAVPTPRAVLGHDPAEVITSPEGIARYFEVLAAADPARTHLVRYAESWEGRPLLLLAIGSPDRIARLDDVRAGLARLADPRGLSRGDEERLIATLPAVTALLHSVHGNEITPAGSALVTAYHLLAARGDADVDRILAESIVLIDPLQNPDGRARFVASNQLGKAATPDPDPLAAEHDEPWPGGRANHYLFDLNRDWFAHTQPESRGKVRALLSWNPHVVVDLHEMGGHSTYYFPPAAVPANPHTTAGQQRLFDLFGRHNAAVFDARGWPYFIREIFDSFYPGYGSSWPTTQGALGKTFEQASPRGLVFERYDGSLLTYGDGIERNFHAAVRTALTTAENREALLREFVDFRRSAIAAGTRGSRTYLLHPDPDPAAAARLARTLAANGIEVGRARAPFRAGGRAFPAGTFVVPLDQPAGRAARNLLDPHTPMDAAFVQLQRERRARRLRDQIYDVTAWNLPHLWNVEAVPLDRAPDVATDPVSAELRAAAAHGSSAHALPAARVGYLVPWTTAGAATVVEALSAGIPVHAAGASFVLGGRRFGPGTTLVRSGEIDAAQRDVLARIVDRHEAEVIAVESAFVDEGISLGSNQMRALRAPRILLLWDAPSSSLSAGWARWVLERRYGQSVTALRVASLPRAELRRYDVIVLPSGNYVGALGAQAVQRLRSWIQEGGTLVTIAEATRWAAADDVGLVATRAEDRSRAAPATGRAEAATHAPPIELLDAITPEQEAPEPVTGAILRIVVDTAHVLSAGTRGELGAMVSGSRVFTPVTLDRGTNVAVYAAPPRLVMSGMVWEEAQPQLASKAFLIHQPLGRGRVIAFAEDPNFRGYAEATQLLFMNAVLLGPAF
jgi:hypothetical protein